MKYTSGSWLKTKTEDIDYSVISVVDGQRHIIAVLIENPADASLISAAPDLLEIAKSIEGLVANVDCSSGVCCCGDSMKNHPDSMYCGHSAVDTGWYAASGLLDKARAAIAKAQGQT
jgi:hypothetical protein